MNKCCLCSAEDSAGKHEFNRVVFWRKFVVAFNLAMAGVTVTLPFSGRVQFVHRKTASVSTLGQRAESSRIASWVSGGIPTQNA
jgi:hypothetical protein